MEREWRFGLVFGRMAVLKKKLGISTNIGLVEGVVHVRIFEVEGGGCESQDVLNFS